MKNILLMFAVFVLNKIPAFLRSLVFQRRLSQKRGGKLKQEQYKRGGVAQLDRATAF